MRRPVGAFAVAAMFAPTLGKPTDDSLLPLEVAAGFHGGAVAGQYQHGGCNAPHPPTGAQRYFGAGAELRWRESPERDVWLREGWTVAGGFAVERRSYSVTDRGGFATAEQPRGFHPAGGVRAGYDWPWFGFVLGVQVWPMLQLDETEPDWSPTHVARPLPLIGLRLGPPVLGMELGSYGSSFLDRPGYYLGVRSAPGGGWEGALRFGAALGLDHGPPPPRFDAELCVPLRHDLRLGIGAALQGENERRGEGRMFVEQRL